MSDLNNKVNKKQERNMKRPMLGELLLEKQYISQDQLNEALKFQEKKGGLLGILLLTGGIITEKMLDECLELQAYTVVYGKKHQISGE